MSKSFEPEPGTKREAEYFRKILDHIPQMVWSTRPDGYHDYYSRTWYEFTGVEVGSTDGEGWNDMFHPEDQARAWGLWRHSLASGEPYEIEYRLRHRSGGHRWVLGRAWPETDPGGAIVRWYGTCTDIHDRVTAEERVSDLQAEVIHLERLSAMGTMAATLAHEVNQPLAAAANFAVGVRRMIERGAAPDEVTGHLAELENAVHRAGDIIRRLRWTATKEKPSRSQTCDVGQLIDEARRLVEVAFGETLDIDLHVQRDASVVADPIRIAQVLVNLITNSAEAMAGCDEKKVMISASAENGYVTFCVADSGPGIAADLLPTVFDAFHSTKKSGMGIGLSISRTIVEDHGGAIWAENRPHGGARLCFSLPSVSPAGIARMSMS